MVGEVEAIKTLDNIGEVNLPSKRGDIT